MYTEYFWLLKSFFLHIFPYNGDFDPSGEQIVTTNNINPPDLAHSPNRVRDIIVCLVG